MSKKFGIFGYRGRIPASFIKSIMIYTGDKESEGFQPGNWTTVTREQLEKAIEFGDMDGEFDPCWTQQGRDMYNLEDVIRWIPLSEVVGQVGEM